MEIILWKFGGRSIRGFEDIEGGLLKAPPGRRKQKKNKNKNKTKQNKTKKRPVLIGLTFPTAIWFYAKMMGMLCLPWI